jgi:hypothetical protein
MKIWRYSLVLFLGLTACGAPSDDIVLEIAGTRSPVIGKVVVLKTSSSLKSGSLAHASEIWVGGGWSRADAALCKPYAPADWQNTQAFTREFWLSDKDKNQIYNILLCASQLDNPKRIGAIGVVTASRKPEPIKP